DRVRRRRIGSSRDVRPNRQHAGRARRAGGARRALRPELGSGARGAPARACGVPSLPAIPRVHRVTTGTDGRESVLGFRVFSSPAAQSRFRRATDILALAVAASGIALLILAYPPTVFERSLLRFFAAIPDWLDPAWRFLYDVLGLWAILLVAACLLA